LVDELKRLTPTSSTKQRWTKLLRALVAFEFLDAARCLQQETDRYTAVVQREESLPMPTQGNATQREAIAKHWNWPQSSYEEARVVFTKDLEARSVHAQRLAWLSPQTELSSSSVPDAVLAAPIEPDRHSALTVQRTDRHVTTQSRAVSRPDVAQ